MSLFISGERLRQYFKDGASPFAILLKELQNKRSSLTLVSSKTLSYLFIEEVKSFGWVPPTFFRRKLVQQFWTLPIGKTCVEQSWWSLKGTRLCSTKKIIFARNTLTMSRSKFRQLIVLWLSSEKLDSFTYENIFVMCITLSSFLILSLCNLVTEIYPRCHTLPKVSRVLPKKYLVKFEAKNQLYNNRFRWSKKKHHGIPALQFEPISCPGSRYYLGRNEQAFGKSCKIWMPHALPAYKLQIRGQLYAQKHLVQPFQPVSGD